MEIFSITSFRFVPGFSVSWFTNTQNCARVSRISRMEYMGSLRGFLGLGGGGGEPSGGLPGFSPACIHCKMIVATL